MHRYKVATLCITQINISKQKSKYMKRYESMTVEILWTLHESFEELFDYQKFVNGSNQYMLKRMLEQ